MAGTEVDGVVFALDGDTAPINKAFAQTEARADKAATHITSSLDKGFKDAADGMGRHSESIRRTLGGLEEKSQQTRKIWETTGESIARSTGLMRVPQSAAASWDTFGRVLGDIKSPAEKLREAFQKTNVEVERGVTVSTRGAASFRTLISNLTTGNLQNVPMTLGLIATRVFGISLATVGATAAIAAIPIALAVAATKADTALSKIRVSMALTGGASGLSLADAGAAANQIAEGGLVSSWGAQRFVGGAMGSLVPGGEIGRAGLAAGQYQLATGATDEQVQGMLRQMFEDPAGAAKDLNASMRLLTAEQTREVQALQRQGENQRAGSIILQAFNDRTREAADAAGFFAKSVNAIKVWGGNVAAAVGGMTGAGQTDLDRYRTLEARRAATLSQGPRGSMVGNLTGAAGTRTAELAAIDKEMAELSAKMAKDRYAATDKAFRSEAGKLITEVMDTANASSNAFETRRKALDDEIARTEKAVLMAKSTGSKFLTELQAQETALKTQRANIKTPAQMAAQEADDARRIARAAPENRARLSAEIAAQREFEKNLQDPSMSGFASSIRDSRMEAAKFNASDAARRDRQDQTLRNMQQQADAEEKVAAAYEEGEAAIIRVRAAQEAHGEFIQKSIRDEKAYTEALLRRAYATEKAAVGQRILDGRVQNEAQQRLVDAGGDPAALARAEALNTATQQTLRQFAAARTPAERAEAQRNKDEIERQENRNSDLGNSQAINSTMFRMRQDLGNQRAFADAFAGGATPDDLRRLEVAQRTFDTLINQGIAPGTDRFRELYEAMLPLNMEASELSESLNKAAREAAGLADSITGPLGRWLTRGKLTGGSIMEMGGEIGQGMLETTVQANLMDPLNEELRGLFGGMNERGSMAKPMYVIPLGGEGAGGAPAGMGGLFSSLFGGGGGAESTGFPGMDHRLGIESSGGFWEGLTSMFAGIFDEGGTIQPGQWGIKSGKPEIIQGGTQGVSIMPLDAPVVRAAIGSRAGNAMGGGPGAGTAAPMGNYREEHHWHLPGVTDVQSFVRARSQLESIVTRSALRGKRNQ